MEHSEKYYKVKEWYDAGHWNKRMVYNAVVKGWITPEEYKEITGEVFG